MSAEQLDRLEEVLAAYRYIKMRLEFFGAFLEWLCIPSNGPGATSENDLQLAHSSLYTGLWVETQPSDEGWPVHVLMSKGSQVVN